MIAEDLANRGHAEKPPFNLEYLTRGGQGDSMRRIALWPGHEKINVVICDFFDSSPLLPLSLKLNGIQARTTNSANYTKGSFFCLLSRIRG